MSQICAPVQPIVPLSYVLPPEGANRRRVPPQREVFLFFLMLFYLTLTLSLSHSVKESSADITQAIIQTPSWRLLSRENYFGELLVLVGFIFHHYFLPSSYLKKQCLHKDR